MKKLLLLLLFTALLFPQEKRFFDSPFGLGIGFTPVWRVADNDALNKKLTGLGFPEVPSSGAYGGGGAGYIYLGFIPNLRIGGQSFSGFSKEKKSVAGVTSETQYEFSTGGLTVEYTLPFIRKAAVSFGLTIGGGSVSFSTDRYSGDAGWNEIWAGYSDSSQSGKMYHRFENKLIQITPTLTVDIPFYRFIAFRIGGGYTLPLKERWTVDSGREVNSVPDNINGSSYYIQAGILFGFFAY